MRCVPAGAPEPFATGARGPSLAAWLHSSDLNFPSEYPDPCPSADHIVGATTPDGVWVVFYGLQVIQIVPEEVHTGWCYDYADEGVSTCAWRVEESHWIPQFHPRHLAGHHHFVLCFYDDIVEVICRELLFGELPFNIAKAIEEYPQLSGAYLTRGWDLERRGEWAAAIADLEKYISLGHDPQSIEYARRLVSRLRCQDPADT